MSYFDGDVYHGTPLYDVLYPSGGGNSEVQRELRGATIVMEFPKARTLRGFGVWEHPNDSPVDAYMLEYCDAYTIDGLTREYNAQWQLACVRWDNIDYFHVDEFPETKARVWRYSILKTRGNIQRVAELELYEAEDDALLDMGIGQGDKDTGSLDLLMEGW